MSVMKVTLRVFGVVAVAAIATSAGAVVPVGSSSLIKVLDYSDTFTGTDFGGLMDRDAMGGFPLSAVDYHGAGVPGNGIPGEGLAVENCYGNPARSWSDWVWSIARDDTVSPGGTWGYPGGSGAGTDTGMTQTGGYWGDWGIEYGLRDRFVVQFDAVQSTDRVDIIFGGVRDNLFNPSNIGIFFRTTGTTTVAEVGVYNVTVGEYPTDLQSGIMYANEWHNYAALVDVPARSIEVFIDEVSRGEIRLDDIINPNTLERPFAGIALSGAAVSVGYCTSDGDRFWSDNFQVGSPDPPGQLPGDADNNGVVNAADAAILAANWLQPVEGGASQGDFNGDKVVDDLDASILAAHWVYGGAAAAVPEPSGLALAAAGLVCLGLLRRRR